MPLINQELFLREWPINPQLRANAYNVANPYYSGRAQAAPPTADRESALAVLAQLRQFIVDGQNNMRKAGRPWDLLPSVLDNLNRAEPWWGWEFETGWISREARGQAIAFAYDNIDGAMFDGEGEGYHPVEITFCPEERSKYLDGTSNAHKFMQWVQDNRNLVLLTGNNDVGTHLNMSHPAITSSTQTAALCKFLNRTLWHTIAVNGQRKQLFGRETIYAGFFPQIAGNKVWVEFKGFRTAYSMEEFERYLKTAEALQKCIDLFVPKAGLYDKAVTNLYDVAFEGADPELTTWAGTPDYPAGAAALHSRWDMGRY